jgi:tetratricopeptide (TPR) repeat protein
VFADYVEGRAEAYQLLRKRKYDQALTAFQELAKGKISDFQKSDALEQAAECARRLKKHDLAAELAEQIPLEPVAKTVQMQNLLAQRQHKQLVEQFKDEDISQWPDWKAGEAYFARGMAFTHVGDGEGAEADLAAAVPLITNNLERAQLWNWQGRNRLTNLKDQDAALEAYLRIVHECRHRGNSVYFYGLVAATDLLREKGDLEKAEETIRIVDATKFKGYWHGALGMALVNVLVDADKNDEALALCKGIVVDEKAHKRNRDAAQKVIDELEGAKK